MISSVANPTIRRVRRLRKRPWRERTGRFLVEGHRAVAVALTSGARLEAIFHTPRAARLRGSLLGDARDAGVALHEVSEGVMAHLTSVATAPDTLGVAAMREGSLATVPSGASGVLLAGVRDPATAGGIMATAAAAGCAVAIAARGTADIYRQSTVRAAAGAHFRLAVVRAADPDRAAKEMRARGARVVSLAADGPAPWDVDLSGPLLLVVPGEDGGDVDAPDARVALPAVDAPPGLGARAAAVLYEWVRQCR